MSTRAAFRPILARLPVATARRTGLAAPRFTACVVAPQAQLQLTPVRAFTSSRLSLRQQLGAKWSKGEPVTYEELKPITQTPNDDVLLIDVREPSEVALGSIPSAVSLPLSSFEKSLSMDEGDFAKTHGFRKPEKTQPIIFFCKAGVRAQTAIDLAKKAGFKQLRNYEGSYADWVAKDQSNNDD